MKIKYVIVLALAVSSLGYSILSIAETQPKKVDLAPLRPPPQSPFERTVAGVGLLEPKSELVSLSAPLPGVVEQVLVKVGDQVKMGQPLVQLDTRHLKALREEHLATLATRDAEIASSKAGVATGQATLDQATSALSFVEKLLPSKAVSAEDVDQRRRTVQVAQAQLSEAQARVTLAEASKLATQAALNSVKVDIARCTISSPLDAQVLQLRIRAGEHADAIPTGDPSPAWIVLGDTSTLHIRVDLDEHEAWRVQPGAAAEAQARGNAALKCSLKFVRFEPLIIPKRSLTGDPTERVDTRVLQVIYALNTPVAGLFPGQQMDVSIAASQ